MKKIILIGCISVSLMACKRSAVERSGIVGKWKLSAYLSDPGDGSGKWQAVDPATPSYLEFRNDGTIADTPPGGYNAAHYRIDSDTTFTLIRGIDSTRVSYRIEGATLTIFPPCIEACGQRYVAVE